MVETRGAAPYLRREIEQPAGPAADPDCIRAVLEAYRSAPPRDAFAAAARTYGQRNPQMAEEDVRHTVARIICGET